MLIRRENSQETLSEEILKKMHAGSSLKPKYPIITPDDLKELDGFILGCPTRYGGVPAQVATFFDQTGQLWATGALVGKFVSMFTSTAGQHSGQEATTLTTFPFFAHHGLTYVPIGYSNPLISGVEVVNGGSPYGASCIANADGSRKPSAVELEIAEHQGKYFGNFVGTFVKGRSAAAAPATTTAAASQVPQKVSEKEGYAVGDETAAAGGAAPALANTGVANVATEKTAEPAAAALVADETAAAEPAPAAETTTAAEPAPAAEATPAATTAAATPATAEKPSQTKPAAAAAPKKKGFFSCCGDSNID